MKIERELVDGNAVYAWSVGDKGGYCATYADAVNDACIAAGYQWECTHGQASNWGDTAEQAFDKFMPMRWDLVKPAFEAELPKTLGQEFEVVIHIREISGIPAYQLRESYLYFRAVRRGVCVS